MAGRPDEALQLIQRNIGNGDTYVLTVTYAAIGDLDKAYEWLLKARDKKIPWYPWMLQWFPQTRPMHDDPRILALAEELGL